MLSKNATEELYFLRSSRGNPKTKHREFVSCLARGARRFYFLELLHLFRIYMVAAMTKNEISIFERVVTEINVVGMVSKVITFVR